MLGGTGCPGDPSDPSGAGSSSSADTSSGTDTSSSGDSFGSTGSSGSVDSTGSSSSDSTGPETDSSSGEPVECPPPDGEPYDYYQATLDAITNLENVLLVGDPVAGWEYGIAFGPMCPPMQPQVMPTGVEPVCAEDFGGCPPPLDSEANPACIGGFCNLMCPDALCPEGMLCVSGNYGLPQCVILTQGAPEDLPPFAVDPYMGGCYPTVVVPDEVDVCVTYEGPCPLTTLATYECELDDDCPGSTFGDTSCHEGLCRLECDPGAPSCPEGMQCASGFDDGPAHCVQVTFDECGTATTHDPSLRAPELWSQRGWRSRAASSSPSMGAASPT